jgi:hypothetical protein
MSIDPITRNLSNLEKYLNGQPDVLVAYIKHFAKVTEPVIDAELEGADAKVPSFSFLCSSRRLIRYTPVPDPQVQDPNCIWQNRSHSL